MRKYLIVIEKAGGNYSGYSPDIPGCGVAADTREETKRLLCEAIEFHLEGLVEDGDPIPEAESTAEYIFVNEPKPVKPTPVGTRS